MSNSPAWFLSVFALFSFAGNSVLCRLALQEPVIDPSSFTALRLCSGALLLALLSPKSKRAELVAVKSFKSFSAATCLFVYALCFSLAYVELNTGTGALILFAVVQLSLLSLSFASGGRSRNSELFGMLVAFIGLLCLLLPGATSPSWRGLVLMTLSGLAWALYTFLGYGERNPLVSTAKNFISTVPLTLVLVLFTVDSWNMSFYGAALAISSGVLCSAFGYIAWYAALKYLSVIQAAVCQLLVPVIAVLGGVIFVSETIEPQIILSSILILGGVVCSIWFRSAKE